MSAHPMSPHPMSPHPMSMRQGTLVWVVATAAFFLMSAGWALGLPTNGTYDENKHSIRAYAAASGQLYAAPDPAVGGANFDVPQSLLPDNVNCTFVPHDKPATCYHPTTTDRTRVPTNTPAGRYNPVYYVLVGLPEVFSPNFSGIVGSRLLSGLVSALLLGAAVAIAWTTRRHLLLAAIVLGVTPMTLNLAGSVNPNGLEISAGILCWTAGLVLLTRDGDERTASTDRLLLWCTAVSAALLLTLRTLGPLFLLMTAAAAVALARTGRVRALLSQRATRVALVALGVVAVYAVGWTLLSGELGVSPTGTGSSDPAQRTLRLIVDRRLDFWAQQFVGIFNYGGTMLPAWMYFIWYALGGALVVPAVLLARRRQALTLVAIITASVGILTVLEVHYRPVLGNSQQGRYLLPFAVGALLGAALVPQWQRALGGVGARRLSVLCLLATAPLQFYALGETMTRFERGVHALWQPLGGGWRPILGPYLPLAAEALGLLLLLAVVVSRPRSSGAVACDAAEPGSRVVAGIS